jgi:hypothetical protein
MLLLTRAYIFIYNMKGSTWEDTDEDKRFNI